MRFAFVEKHAEQFDVETMCRVLEVSRSGYYAWRRRPLSRRAREDRQLLPKIRAIHERWRQSYGSPRIYRELKDNGVACGKHRVARLMREAGLRAKHKRRFRPTTDSAHSHPVAPNRLKREFSVTRLDAAWLADITYLWTREGWLYLALVMDLCSRRILGWAMATRINQDLTLAALRMAILHGRRPEVHHSDRGSQYASKAYRKALKKLGVQASMSRKGDCWDNAPMESCIGSLKVEWTGDIDYVTREEAHLDVFKYIEVFYNRKRRHSSLGFLSPIEYEMSLSRRFRDLEITTTKQKHKTLKGQGGSLDYLES